jgi:hypothetical protein
VSPQFAAREVITKCSQSKTTFITLIGFHHLFSINNSLYAKVFQMKDTNIKNNKNIIFTFFIIPYYLIKNIIYQTIHQFFSYRFLQMMAYHADKQTFHQYFQITLESNLSSDPWIIYVMLLLKFYKLLSHKFHPTYGQNLSLANTKCS